jgi:N-methylhydantoinase A
MDRMLLGVDVGGTFTDAVLLDGDSVHAAKAPSTPANQAEGVLAAVEAVLAEAEAEAGEIEHFAHGMTVGTNALLERRGARTLLVATGGFTDLIEIGRQDRVSLYRLCADRPPPLAPTELRVGVAERCGPEGVIEPLTEQELERVVAAARKLEPEAIAVCLLFAYAEPGHERALAGALRAALPGTHVSASSEVLPRFREYERCSTTLIDAYLSPLLGRYLERLGRAAAERGLPEPVVMQSSGGVAPLHEAAAGAAWSVLSGPAGGAVGAGLLARLSGAGNALGFDMGGTSCDVCVIEAGRVGRSAGREIGGRPIELPMVDVHTVGAGGGSIARRDRGGVLRVGPESAGAEPGPACYGRGGEQPTVTDANLLLGLLGAEAGLAGGVGLDRDAAERAVGRLATELGIGTLEAAAGIVRVANEEMIRALRVVSVERGHDPRDFALVAFGGAGGLHAAAIAARLGIARVLFPATGGMLSALGLAVSERRRDRARSLLLSPSQLTDARLRTESERLAAEARRGLEPGARTELVCELRYAGQSFELEIPANPAEGVERLRERFAAAHRDRYGYEDPAAEIELVGLRVAAIEPGPEWTLRAAGEREPQRGSRKVHLDGERLEAAVLTGAAPGLSVEGPAILELAGSTVLVPPGASGTIDERGTLDVRLGNTA